MGVMECPKIEIMWGDRVELKPCPFCGGKASLFPNDEPRLHRHSRNGKYAVCCWDCDMLFGYDIDYGGQFDTEEEAVQAWNMRV